MFITYIKDDMTSAFAYDSKEQVQEALEEEIKMAVLTNREFKNSIVIEVKDTDFTNNPSSADYYIEVTGYLPNGDELPIYSHEQLSWEGELGGREFVGLYSDGSYKQFNGDAIEWDDAY